jgi:cytosolic carboxypeptidase protein 2/3
MCKSLSGLAVPLLTITSRIHTDENYNLIRLEEFDDVNSRISLPLNKKKRYAVISGRVHPGETPSSWMMQGFLKYICGNSHQAIQLRKRIVFKIVPILNPDGVIAGNYRTSMAGNDLNRKFDEPDYRLHPTVWNIKRMTERITSD